MTNEEIKTENLRVLLKGLLTVIESQHRRLDELSNRVGALQATVSPLDPAFDEVHAAMIAEIASVTAPLAPLRDEQFAQLRDQIEATPIP